MLKSQKQKKIVSTISVVVGILIGMLCAYPALAKVLDNKDTQHFPTNIYGQTYGSDKDAVSWEKAPDLISVSQKDVNGYVYREDLYQNQINMPKSPEDTTGWQKWIEKYGTGYQIPVYEVDGKTIIGQFTVAGDYSNTNNADSANSYPSPEDASAAQNAKG